MPEDYLPDEAANLDHQKLADAFKSSQDVDELVVASREKATGQMQDALLRGDLDTVKTTIDAITQDSPAVAFGVITNLLNRTSEQNVAEGRQMLLDTAQRLLDEDRAKPEAEQHFSSDDSLSLIEFEVDEQGSAAESAIADQAIEAAQSSAYEQVDKLLAQLPPESGIYVTTLAKIDDAYVGSALMDARQGKKEEAHHIADHINDEGLRVRTKEQIDNWGPSF